MRQNATIQSFPNSGMANIRKTFQSILEDRMSSADMEDTIRRITGYTKQKSAYYEEAGFSTSQEGPFIVMLPWVRQRDENLSVVNVDQDRQGFKVIAFRQPNNLWSFDVNHIPFADDYKKISASDRRYLEESLDARIEYFTEKLARAMTDLGRRKFLNSFKGNVISENQDISALLDPQKWVDKNIRREVQRFVLFHLDIHVEGHVRSSLKYDPESEALVDVGDAIEDYTLVSEEEYERLCDAVTEGIAGRIKPVASHFKQELDQDAIDVLDSVKGQQTSGLYYFLTPYTKETFLEDDKEGNAVRRRRRVLDEKVAMARRAFFRHFPVAASSLNFSNGKGFNKIAKVIEKEESAFAVAVKYFGLDRGNNEADIEGLLSTLSSMNEETVGYSAARSMPNLGPLLTFVEEGAMPETVLEWRCFERAAQVDNQFSRLGLRSIGACIYDLTAEIAENAESAEMREESWIEQSAQYANSYTRDILTMLKRVGLSVFAPYMAGVRDHYDRRDISNEDVLLAAVTKEERFFGAASTDARRYMQQDNVLTLVGEMAKGKSLQDLKRLTGFYMAHQAEFEGFLSQMAAFISFNDAAGAYKWKPLPAPAAVNFDGTMEDDAFSFDEIGPGDQIVAIDTPADLLRYSQQLRTVIDVREYVYTDVHYVAVKNRHDGRLRSLAKLTQRPSSQTELDLEIDTLYTMDGEVLYFDRGEVNTNNAELGTVLEYIEWLNDQKIGKHPYDMQRKSVRKQAEQRAGFKGIIGHDYKDVEQNSQVVQQLRDVLRDLGLMHRHVFKGIPHSPEMYAHTVHTMNAIGDKTTPLPKSALKKSLRVIEN